MFKNRYLVLLPGIILAFVLYTLSQGFNNIVGIELLGYEKSPISTAMIAILLGMFFGNVFKIRESFIRGLDFTQKNILKLGIICLGIQLKPFEFLEFGAKLDMENCFPKINDGGIMVVDDYRSGPPNGCYLQDVNNAVEDFAKTNNLSFDSWNEKGKGFAIFKK